MGWLLGLCIWLGMTIETAVISIFLAFPLLFFTVIALFVPARWPLLNCAWRVALLALAAPFAALLMPAFILAWPILPAPLAYWLNTPDDPDPATQGWNGQNKEPQVIWVRTECGAYWCRVYWLVRNCINGAAVSLRPSRPDFATATYTFDGFLCRCASASGVQWMMVVPMPMFGRVARFYFGAWLKAYLDALKVGVVVINANPTEDARADPGAIPCLKVKLERASDG